MALDKKAEGLLTALNELSQVDWVCWFEAGFYHYKLIVEIPDRLPFIYKRPIRPNHIDGQPFRTALRFIEEAAERLGRYLIVKPDGRE